MVPVLAAEISFEILEGKDAPGNDFKRLNGVSVETCQARCAEETRCAAFTYNRRVSVCFLKDSANPELSDYRGATTGLKQATAQAPAQVPQKAPSEAEADVAPSTADGEPVPPPPVRPDEPETPVPPAAPPGPEIAMVRTGDGCTLFDGDFALTRNPNIVLRFARISDGADEADRARMVFTDRGTEMLSGRLTVKDNRFAFAEDTDGSVLRSVTILDGVSPSSDAVRDPVFVVVGGLPFDGGTFRRVECRAP